jgi:nucleoside 2-deoxyribosyltransferase
MSMKCFVASAFDKNDVDLIYDRGIVAVLRDLKVTALRVDRVQHNEDIDDKIFELLDAADVCIADLTYARPSVYYEAGYAVAAEKPVIYIARADHFHPKPEDRAGNERIHFDLQMRNIIPWEAPNAAFKNALRRRVQHVIRPLLRTRTISEGESQQKLRFSNLPLNQRIRSLLEKGTNLLRRRGYQRGRFSEALVHPYYGVQYDRLKASIHQRVHLAAGRTINDSEFERIRQTSRNCSAAEACLTKVTKAKAVEDLIAIATLGPFRSDRLAQLLPHFSRVSDRVFQHTLARKGDDVPVVKTVAAISSIESIEDFAMRFLDLLEERKFA